MEVVNKDDNYDVGDGNGRQKSKNTTIKQEEAKQNDRLKKGEGGF